MTTLFTVAFYTLSVLATSCGQVNNSTPKNIVELSDTVKIKVGNSPGSVETADFNNDGFPDLAVTSETDSSVTILLGNGKGDFIPANNSPVHTGPLPNDIGVADFNNDGNMDLAIANHEQQYLTVLLGNGKGNFTPAKKFTFPDERHTTHPWSCCRRF